MFRKRTKVCTAGYERHVMLGPRERRADVRADRAGPDDGEFHGRFRCIAGGCLRLPRTALPLGFQGCEVNDLNLDSNLTNLRELLECGKDDCVALRGPGTFAVTYARLRADVDAFAAELGRRGISPGDRVALVFPNGPAIVEAFFSVAVSRAAAAPLNPAYTRDEYRFYLEDIDPKMLLVAPGEAALAREAAGDLGIAIVDLAQDAQSRLVVGGVRLEEALHRAEPRADDVALFLHTSGTTSRPKGVPLTHRNLCASAENIVRWYEIDASDVSLCVMPLFHVHGLVFSTLATLLAGGLEVVPERFSAGAFWPLVEANQVTIVSAVPTIYRTLMLRADEDGAPRAGGHRLRFLRSSSAPLPAAEMLRLVERFGTPVIEAYSMTEASHQMTANPLAGPWRPGSVGFGAFVGVAVMDENGALLAAGETGEVVVRGENVTRGYHNNPEANAQAFTRGWFRTGDLGTVDAEGCLTLVGRLKELINSGGEKISPIEVDEALLSHPGVKEAVAFAVPDVKYGETVAAAVVVEEGTQADDVRAHVASRLAAVKVPSVLYLVEEIPKTATGKVQRRVVAAAFATKSRP
jgi:acyl-CoA synthetase (AMP-forming)/AMP-acid ligase II